MEWSSVREEHVNNIIVSYLISVGIFLSLSHNPISTLFLFISVILGGLQTKII